MDVIEKTMDAQGILTLCLNRPNQLNALSLELLESLEAAFIDAATKGEVKAIILTGAGKAFCAGADITRLGPLDKSSGRAFAEQGQRVFSALETLSKPSVAAINGYALGGGCELAMAATFRFAANTAVFGQPELKLGVIPGFGGTQRLPRLVGISRALDLCLSGRSISAEEALHWGLINGLFPLEALLEESKRYLQKVLSMGPIAVALTIKAIQEGMDMPLPKALGLEAELFGEVCASSDKNEGVSAFLAKRPAVFQGV